MSTIIENTMMFISDHRIFIMSMLLAVAIGMVVYQVKALVVDAVEDIRTNFTGSADADCVDNRFDEVGLGRS